MKKLKSILFIDENFSVANYHEFMSRRSNLAEVTLTFTNPDKAFEYLEAIRSAEDFPELIFMDINIPNMHSHRFAYAVKKLPSFNEQRTRMVYLTTNIQHRPFPSGTINNMKHYYYRTMQDVDLAGIVRDVFPAKRV